MVPPLACPSADVLARLTDADLSVEGLDEILLHVERCELCTGVVRDLQGRRAFREPKIRESSVEDAADSLRLLEPHTFIAVDMGIRSLLRARMCHSPILFCASEELHHESNSLPALPHSRIPYFIGLLPLLPKSSCHSAHVLFARDRHVTIRKQQ